MLRKVHDSQFSSIYDNGNHNPKFNCLIKALQGKKQTHAQDSSAVSDIMRQKA
jgi:hypothetical protein